MNRDVLLTDLKKTVVDLYAEAQRGDPDARRWLLESFPGHELFLLSLWPEASSQGCRLTPGDFRLLESYAWNIESRLLVKRLARIVTQAGGCNRVAAGFVQVPGEK